eukprot:139441-Alexandrium_andersonii.AAC.1
MAEEQFRDQPPPMAGVPVLPLQLTTVGRMAQLLTAPLPGMPLVAYRRAWEARLPPLAEVRRTMAVGGQPPPMAE